MNATAREAMSAPRVTGIVSIVTHRIVAAPVARVWSSLQFYEELDRQPPWLLRLLLPQPERAVTSPRAQGDETTLPYVGGHYTKRVTKLEAPHRYEFDVLEQRLPADHGVMLLSGAYTLRELSADQTDLAITRRYASRLRPRWLAEPIERHLCHRLQRHLLDGVQVKAAQ